MSTFRSLVVTRSIATLSIATLPLAPAAAAPADSPVQQVVITAPSAQDLAAHTRRVLNEHSFDTHYELSNGRRLSLVAATGALRMRYDGRRAVTLQRDELGRFVSADGNWVLRFAADAASATSQLHLTLPQAWQ